MLENPFAEKKYLVVDDFGDMRTMFKGLLRMLGATKIDAVRDGKEAIKSMEYTRYDVVLCDYNLGRGMDGQQVLEEARYLKLIGVGTIFIMVTAENTRDMVMAVVEYEPDSYLAKPFTKELLRTRLVDLIRRKNDLEPVNSALRKFDYPAAVRLLNDRIAQRPRNLPELIKLKGDVLLKSMRLNDAQALFEDVLLEREIPWARMGLGKVNYYRKRYPEALENFAYVVENAETVTIAYDWLAKTQRAIGETKLAEETLSVAVDLSPNAILRRRELGRVAMQTGNHKLAEKSLRAAVKLGKYSVHDHPATFANLARVCSEQGNHDEAELAVQHLKVRFKNKPDARFYAATAEAAVLRHKGDTERARECLAQAEELYRETESQDAKNMGLELARVASDLGDTDKATRLLHAAVVNNHEDTDFLQHVTDTLHDTGIGEDPAALVQDLRQSVVEMNNRGVILIREEKYEQAIELFVKAAEGMEQNRIINLNAARALIMRMEKGGPESDAVMRARRYIDRARRVAPHDPSLGVILRRLQRVIGSGLIAAGRRS